MNKKVIQEFNPESPKAKTRYDPATYNNMRPSWCFRACDEELWNFSAENFMNDILPKLKEFETQTWNEILIRGKKNNHSIDSEKLNKVARERLEKLKVEAASIISLRLSATHRLYGYRIDGVYYILWYDNNHGDNSTCVCRSRKK